MGIIMNNGRFHRVKGLAMPALLICLALNSFASEHPGEVEEVHVYGHEPSLALPVKKLDQEDLEKAQSGNMTKLLEQTPGISNASFGEGVGRPVIRGMSANRVKLSINGASNADVSNKSSDHAPMMEIDNADEVEVIYGPNILRFGGGAMGGLVNVNDSRFHDEIFEGVKARLRGASGSNAGSSQLAGSIDLSDADSFQTQANIVHADFFVREADNFSAGEINKRSEEVDSSALEAQGGSVAYNFVTDKRGAVGVAIGFIDHEYGIPNDEGNNSKVTPEQWRMDIQGHVLNLSSFLEKWETKFSYVDYVHEELIDDSPEALFEKEVIELQSTLFFHTKTDWIVNTGFQFHGYDLSVCHDHGGCFEIPDYSSTSWDGERGANLDAIPDSPFSFSHSTPMPLVETSDIGVFVIVGKSFNALTMELGARYDTRTISADPVSIAPSYRRAIEDYDDVTFNPFSFSTGLSWDFQTTRLALNVSHSERAPTSDEMFYNGDHHATFSFQLDNINLDIETANSIDVTYQRNLGNISFEAALFHYEFSDYIYNDIKPVSDPFHGRDVYRYEQEDASFSGGELNVEAIVGTHWTLFSGFDFVNAKLKEGENRHLPRTPPASLRSGVQWYLDRWEVETSFHHFFEQDNVAANESTSDAFTTLNAYIAYTMQWRKSEATFQLKANNVLNEYGVNHTSYLKDFSPVPGRNIEASFVLRY